MQANDIKSMTTQQLVDACVWLDRESKKNKAISDKYKAELQERALSEMDDHNVKFVKYYSDEGAASVTDGASLDVLNPEKLKEILGEGLWKNKVTESENVTYKYDKKLEKALKAIFTGDYIFDMDLDEFLDQMSIVPDSKQKKLLLKRLKGDFESDKKLLEATLLPEGETHDFDVELFYIYKIKNAELIRSFIPEEMIDRTLADIRKYIIVETKTAIKIEYDKEEA